MTPHSSEDNTDDLARWLRISAARSISASTPISRRTRTPEFRARRASLLLVLGAPVALAMLVAVDRRGWQGDRLTTRRPRV